MSRQPKRRVCVCCLCGARVATRSREDLWCQCHPGGTRMSDEDTVRMADAAARGLVDAIAIATATQRRRA